MLQFRPNANYAYIFSSRLNYPNQNYFILLYFSKLILVRWNKLFDNFKSLLRKPTTGATGGGKKGTLGAKKLTTSVADARMESFEAVEKRAQLVQQKQQEDADKRLALQLQQEEGSTSSTDASSVGGGRVASLLRDTDEKTSIYRSNPVVNSSASL